MKSIYFANIHSFDELKKRFRDLAREHHPDAGGDPEVMKAINSEYDLLFPIWKDRAGVVTSETASSTRSEFYTANGWKGSKYDWHRSLKEISALVRAYVKEMYPSFKFSVTKSNYNALHVCIKEGYTDIFLDPNAKGETYFKGDHWRKETFTREASRMFTNINAFVQQYNYEDIDGMIDYFSVGFWYHGVETYGYKVNPELKAKAEKAAKKTRKVAV